MLVRRGVDGLLVGWLAVIVWVGVYLAQKFGINTAVPAIQAIYWTGAVVTAAHFGLSYHLAYRGGIASVRQRPVALLWGPLAVLGVLGLCTMVSLSGGAAVTKSVTEALISLVYLATTWHYIKQVYGVGRVGAAYARVSLDKWDVRILRYGLYPLWFVGASQVLVRSKPSGIAGFNFGYNLLPESSVGVLQFIAICSALPVAWVIVRIVMRTGRFPSLLAAPYAASFLWLGLNTSVVLTLLLLAPFHAMQYLAIGHRAEVALASQQPGTHGLLWWLNIFGGAACGGLLLSLWAPQYLDAQINSDSGLLFTAAFFVFLNLHHYLIDASIWRSKGELVKALVRKPSPPTSAAVAMAPGVAAQPVRASTSGAAS